MEINSNWFSRCRILALSIGWSQYEPIIISNLFFFARQDGTLAQAGLDLFVFGGLLVQQKGGEEVEGWSCWVEEVEQQRDDAAVFVILPETNSSNLQNGWLEYDHFLLGRLVLFWAANRLLVLGRLYLLYDVWIWAWVKLNFCLHFLHIAFFQGQATQNSALFEIQSYANTFRCPPSQQ